MMPTYQNPAIIVFDEAVPALKNSRELYKNKKTNTFGHKPNATVKKFMSKHMISASKQYAEQGFDLIEEPQAIACVSRFVFYVADKNNMSKKDTINARETIQDTLQGSVYEDDRQLLFNQEFAAFCPNSLMEHAICWIWALDEEVNPWDQMSYVGKEFASGNTDIFYVGWNGYDQ